MTPADLKTTRANLGLTQKGLAERLFMTREHVAQMERGAKPITERTASQVGALAAPKSQSGGQ
jgi:transcriptional regulator with XRE-family HTH domain